MMTTRLVKHGLQRFTLAWGQRLSGLLFTPGDGLLEVDLRVGHAGSWRAA